MFEVVARANIHQQQVVKLLKQRSRVHSSLVYQQARIATLEQHLCAHLYALLDVKRDELPSEILALVSALEILSDEQLNSEQLFAYYEQETSSADALALSNAIILLVSLLPSAYLENKLALTFEHSYLEETLYRNSQLLELLVHLAVPWPAEPLQVIRQSVLAEQFTPSLSVACLLFGQANVTTQELAKGYQHAQFSIAQASFVKGLIIDETNAKNALFNRFAKTPDVDEKATLLVLAGLSGDSRWIEPCIIFCQDYPEHTFNVLSHFQHKIFFNIFITLMAIAQTSDEAYRAWLLITNIPLLKKPQLQDHNNKHKQAGEQNLPNTDQAELHRQALLQQPGEKMLTGIEFSNNDAAQKLQGLQGKAVQHALLLSPVIDSAITLYSQQLSAISLKKIITQTPKSTRSDTNKHVIKGALHVA
ncbi:hypothetical protein GCM10009111_25710 [Colwellia asteriadis]|uniref:Uncharacterized protein n=1 Tax=Colwellia asteriadis TaxID=517723 RepID=A0ABP3WLJ1_9GAMM